MESEQVHPSAISLSPAATLEHPKTFEDRRKQLHGRLTELHRLNCQTLVNISELLEAEGQDANATRDCAIKCFVDFYEWILAMREQEEWSVDDQRFSSLALIRIEEMLPSIGLYRFDIYPGTPFEPTSMKVLHAVPCDDPTLHMKVSRGLAHGWVFKPKKHPFAQRIFQPALVELHKLARKETAHD